MCSDLGISDPKNKSLTDLSVEILNILKDDSTYKKAFKSIYKKSGGYATLSCPHGVVSGFGSKLRQEGLRDVGDMLESLEYLIMAALSLWQQKICSQNQNSCISIHPNVKLESRTNRIAHVTFKGHLA